MNTFKVGAALAAVLFASPYAESFNLPAASLSTSSATKKASSLPSSSSEFSGFLPSSSTTTTRLYSTLESTKKKKDDDEVAVVSAASVNTDTTNDDSTTNKQKIVGNPIPYSELTVGVLKETYPGENRVSVAPESVKMLVDAGLSVVVESGGEF